MAEIEAYDEIAKKIVERAIDEFIYEGKSLREWINMVNQIQKGPTNGDMIKAMFPDAKIERGLYGIGNIPLICLNLGTNYAAPEMSFIEDWWNTPYNQKVEE